jgi:ribonuclease-3
MDTPHEAAIRFAQRSGLTFRDPSLLARALTHPSYAREAGCGDYERLEFLGDSVLGLVAAEHLFRTHADAAEGDLTRMKVAAVRGRALAAAAGDIDLGAALVMGRGADRGGDRERSTVLEAAFEALVGAIYLDGGLDAARAFALEHLGDHLGADALQTAGDDSKTLLQEATQAAGAGLPVYRITGQSGPDHERRFMAQVEVAGDVAGTGAGHSKQAAEKDAARDALGRLRPMD